MKLEGFYTEKDKFACKVRMNLNEYCDEIVFYNENSSEVISAYIRDGKNEYCLNNDIAMIFGRIIRKNCNIFSKKGSINIASKIGTLSMGEKNIKGMKFRRLHDREEVKVDTRIEMCGQLKEITDIIIENEELKFESHFVSTGHNRIFTEELMNNFKFVKINNSNVSTEQDDVIVRSVDEIALTKKDVTWIKNKKYYVIADDNDAEKIFNFLVKYNGKIAYDTETTGLRINCFSKRNSEYEKLINKYNEEHPDNIKRVDKLVGIIFCYRENESFYFPCGNRKFRNLYSDGEIREQVINNIKANYTCGELSDINKVDTDMRDYVLNTKNEDFDCDIILMERVRKILETRNLSGWNTKFDYKVGLSYGIDTHFVSDGQIAYNLLFKFNSKKFVSSKLKVRTYEELGVETWELEDFFPDYKESENTGLTRVDCKIDFSYMTLEGTYIYAPADGDFTFILSNKYERYMRDNCPKMEYIYNIEVQVACAGGYMEYYGIRIDEEKIEAGKFQLMFDIRNYVHQMREILSYDSDEETESIKLIEQYVENKEYEKAEEEISKFDDIISRDKEKSINFSSNQQLAKLLYDDLKIPLPAGRRSVDKAAREFMENYYIDENGNQKYKIIELLSSYTKRSTLLKLFFNKLPDYMYPTGLIFPQYFMIGTDTGRMSCKYPNMQQTCKEISSITVPRAGYVMVDSDYSQIEQRIMVGIAKQQSIVDLFKDPKTDFHTLVASMMFHVMYTAVDKAMRKQAKGVGFGTLYGMGDKSRAIKVCGNSNPESIEIAKQRQRQYFDMMPLVEEHIREVKEYATVYSKTETLFHRVRQFNFYDEEGKVNHAKKAAILRQAANAEIQGTAADIFKIGVVRMFYFIRKYNLFGKFLISNMIHDEMLCEVDTRYLNSEKAVVLLNEAMCFDIDGFPPLYTGAGVDRDWAHAKDKMAEMSPVLMEELKKDTADKDIWLNAEHKKVIDNSEVVYKWFKGLNKDFRKRYIIDNLRNTKEGEVVHPEIVSLLELQFNYGRGDDCKSYNKKNGTKLNENEFFRLCLKDFFEEYGINDLEVEKFYISDEFRELSEEKVEIIDDIDNEEVDNSEYYEEEFKNMYTVIEENIEGVDTRVLTKEFGCVIIEKDRSCRIDVGNRNKSDIEILDNVINANLASENEDSYRVYLLGANLNWIDTGIYVKRRIAESV